MGKKNGTRKAKRSSWGRRKEKRSSWGIRGIIWIIMKESVCKIFKNRETFL